MKLMFISTNKYDYYRLEDILGKNNIDIFQGDFEDYQYNYDCIYSPNPNYLIDKKLKIPYFYDISTVISDYTSFKNFYSKLNGASGVFVWDKIANKFAEWLGLNTFWSLNYIIPKYFIPKKFQTPKLHIGVDYKDPFFENIYTNRCKNWIFHILGQEEPKENCMYYSDIEELWDTCHIFISQKGFKSYNLLEMMSSGCAIITTNIEGNHSNIVYNDIHYIKISNNYDLGLLLRNYDKKREKLERISIAGSKVIHKYFNCSKILKERVEIIKGLI